eukprot:5420371-Amphidinium_carterae.1
MCRFVRLGIAGGVARCANKKRHLKKPHRFVWSSPPTPPQNPDKNKSNPDSCSFWGVHDHIDVQPIFLGISTSSCGFEGSRKKE